MGEIIFCIALKFLAIMMASRPLVCLHRDKKAKKLIEKILIWHHAGTEASSAKQHFFKCMHSQR